MILEKSVIIKGVYSNRWLRSVKFLFFGERRLARDGSKSDFVMRATDTVWCSDHDMMLAQ